MPKFRRDNNAPQIRKVGGMWRITAATYVADFEGMDCLSLLSAQAHQARAWQHLIHSCEQHLADAVGEAGPSPSDDKARTAPSQMDRIEAKLDEILSCRKAVCVWCGHAAEDIAAARDHDCECKSSPMWQNAVQFAREVRDLKAQFKQDPTSAIRRTAPLPCEARDICSSEYIACGSLALYSSDLIGHTEELVAAYEDGDDMTLMLEELRGTCWAKSLVDWRESYDHPLWSSSCAEVDELILFTPPRNRRMDNEPTTGGSVVPLVTWRAVREGEPHQSGMAAVLERSGKIMGYAATLDSAADVGDAINRDACAEDEPKTWTDQCLRTLPSLIDDVHEENLRQLDKWGQQTRPPCEWLTFLAEEVGETAKAIGEHVFRDGTADAIHDEAIQAATLLLKIAEMAWWGDQHSPAEPLRPVDEYYGAFKVFHIEAAGVSCSVLACQADQAIAMGEVEEYFDECPEELTVTQAAPGDIITVDFDGHKVPMPAYDWALIHRQPTMLCCSEY